MNRCEPERRALRRRSALALLGTFALAPVARNATAQEIVSRRFPATALRGTLTFSSAPDVVLNGAAARLAPGARIRDTRNLLVVTGALTGQTLVVHYTVEINGLLQDLWILRTDEIANFWPQSAAQAALYTFDPAAQTWSKN